MLHPQIIVHERDGRLAQQLQPLAEQQRWPLREPRQSEPLWRLLRQGGPTVLVVKLSRDPTRGSPERELALLERVSWHLPDVATVAVGDPEDAAALAGLAWDVGVSFALVPPLSRDLLPDIVTGLMRRAIGDTIPGRVETAEAPRDA
jgi:hypothetical protein